MIDGDTQSTAPDPLTSAIPRRDLIVGSGELAKLVRQMDWSGTPLGPIAEWSETLVSYVNLVLGSPLPATLCWGKDLTFFYNDAAVVTLGERHPKALGCSYREVFRDAWHLVGPDIESCFGEGKSHLRENVYIPLLREGGVEDGYYTYALVPVYENGRVIGVYDPYQNTTEIILAQRERARQEERLELALSAANGVGIREYDIPKNLVYADRRLAEMYGLDPTEGRQGVDLAVFLTYVHTNDVDRVSREIAVAVQEGSGYASEYGLLQPDGTTRSVFAKGRCYRGPDGKPLRFAGVTIDITARKTLEDAVTHAAGEIRKSEVKLRTFVEAVTDVVYRVSADWSHALEVEGRGFLPDTQSPDADWFTKNVHPLDQARVKDAIQQSIREGTTFEMEHMVQRLDGTAGWTFSRAIPIKDENGVIQEWFGAASDITTRKQAELTLMQNEKLAVVGRLASSIAHEINNPLESVTNLLYLILGDRDLAEIHAYAATAERELRRVSLIANQALQFHKQSTHATTTTCQELISDTLIMFHGRLVNNKVEVEQRLRARRPVQCFVSEIKQVLNNLIGNGIDAMPSGGRLLLRTREATHPGTGQSGLVLTVADTGTGMPLRSDRKSSKPSTPPRVREERASVCGSALRSLRNTEGRYVSAAPTDRISTVPSSTSSCHIRSAS